MAQKMTVLALLSILTLSLSACGNTLNGAGRDMSGWGQTMQDTF